MSRRTAEASKAIAGAWQREQELVITGKGTRDWTREQQRDIIARGKAYDESGRAFEGHHMRSAEAYPDYQGDFLNIQFLTRQEHLRAHDGNFQNPTNGFFDPNNAQTNSFVDKIEPCPIIYLSDPIYLIDEYECFDYQQQEDEQYNLESNDSSKEYQEKPEHQGFKRSREKRAGKGLRRWVKENIGDLKLIFFECGKMILREGCKYLCDSIVQNILNSNNITDSTSKVFKCDDGKQFASNDVLENQDNVKSLSEPSCDASKISGERASPKLHTVSKHKQCYHTKEGEITKIVDSYQRGGQKSKSVDT